MTETTTKQVLGPNQTKWLDALRSGKYEQGTGCLRGRDNRYCCLGVACEALGMDASLREGIDRYYYDECFCVITPVRIAEQLGLYNGSGYTKDNDPIKSLVYLNDTRMKSFEEIANAIDEDPTQYFKEPR